MRALLDLLTPSSCDGCGVRAPPPWCDDCDAVAQAMRPTDPCPRCAGADVEGHGCWPDDAPVSSTVAVTSWRGPVARAVLHAKLAGRHEVLEALGHRIAAVVTAGSAPRPDVVVPVPSDPRRARQRGLDHTRVLARAVGDGLGRPSIRALRVGVRLPDRGRQGAEHRGALPPGAFLTTSAAAAIAGRRVLLVDDLVTTGGTLAAAARALVSCGPADLGAAVVARAGGHRLHG